MAVVIKTSVNIPHELWRRFRVETTRLNVTASEIITEAVRLWVESAEADRKKGKAHA